MARRCHSCYRPPGQDLIAVTCKLPSKHDGFEKMLVKAAYFRQAENPTIIAQFQKLINFLDGGEVCLWSSFDHTNIRLMSLWLNIGHRSRWQCVCGHKWGGKPLPPCRRLQYQVSIACLLQQCFKSKILIERGKYHTWSFTNSFNESLNTTTITTSGQELTQISNS